MTYPYDPYRTAGPTGPAGDRTWRQTTWSRVQWLAVPVIMTVVALGFLRTFGAGWGGWFGWAFVAVLLLGLVSAVRETLRAAHRVTLRRDGTLELVRPIGTVRVRIEAVRAMRVSRFDNNNGSPIRLLTDQGTYRVTRGLDDLDGLVEVLRERNPRIELPGL